MRYILALMLTATIYAAENSVVTIYSDGYAVVREHRALNLTTGDNTITIGDLPKNVLGESFQIGGDGLSVRPI